MNLDDIADRLRADPDVSRLAGGRIYVGPPDSLDAAWAEAEAALPEGWHYLALVADPSLSAEGGRYEAAAGEWDDAREAFGFGPTPAAALRDLAAKLREPNHE